MPTVEIFHDDANALFLPDAQLKKLATGAEWGEGPVYIADLSMLL